MPPLRGEGMTDSPTRGLSTSRDTGTGARTRPPPAEHPGAADFPFSASPACAARRRRPGPPAATRSALRADPGHRRLSRRAHKPRRRRSKTPRTRLTDPAPFRDDQRQVGWNPHQRLSASTSTRPRSGCAPGGRDTGVGRDHTPRLLCRGSCRRELLDRILIINQRLAPAPAAGHGPIRRWLTCPRSASRIARACHQSVPDAAGRPTVGAPDTGTLLDGAPPCRRPAPAGGGGAAAGREAAGQHAGEAERCDLVRHASGCALPGRAHRAVQPGVRGTGPAGRSARSSSRPSGTGRSPAARPTSGSSST